MTDAGSAPADNAAWSAMEPAAALERLAVDPARGLSAAEAEARLETSGPNEIETREPFSLPAAVARQFIDPLVLILIAAAALSALVGEELDAVVIGVIVVVNATLGFFQEWRAERALAALAQMMAPTARLVRDGRVQDIPAREVAPGDVVELRQGDRAPADLKLIEARDLSFDESALTGESRPVDKAPGADAPDAALAARRSLAHAGTMVAAGRARAVVVATGADTEFGRIAVMAAKVRRGATPLQRRLSKFAQRLGLISVSIAAAVLIFGAATGRSALEMFMTGVSLAVAVVPEGLPAIVALSLALGARAMARRNALLRRLSAAETLGSTTIICTDKTGTLTTGAMTVARLVVASGAVAPPFRAQGAADAEAAAALATAAICNDAGFDDAGKPAGAPTEAALLAAARAAGVDGARAARRVRETPFSSERKMMSVVAADGDGLTAHVKGAPDRVIPLCGHEFAEGETRPLDAAGRARWAERASQMAGRGLRVIALGRRKGPGDGDTGLEEGALEILALAGIRDPLRQGAAAAVETARAAGVRVLMITGDAHETASAVAGELGLPDAEPLRAAELDTLDDAALSARLAQTSVISRAEPRHKLRIVELLQAAGDIVAMTGDGVNDAPALKKADIGVAMGVRGADAARAAADMVLLDDDFSTIIEAMREGRRQDDNIRKFVRYLLAMNFGEAFAVLANIIAGAPLILQPAQILWMNLVTDSAPALALGLEPVEARAMQRPPRRPGHPMLDAPTRVIILGYGLALATAALGVFHVHLGGGVALAQTHAFAALVALQCAMVFGFRAVDAPITKIGFAANRWLLWAVALALALQLAAIYLWPLNLALGATPLPASAWGWLAGLGVVLIVLGEGVKLVARRFGRG